MNGADLAAVVETPEAFANASPGLERSDTLGKAIKRAEKR
jgi:hypothetical protein